jgi:hypothetical protein
MHLHLLGDVGFDVPQKGEKFLMPMPQLALGEHSAVGDIERGKQRSRAVANVVVGDTLDVSQAHGQQRLGACKSLNLAFLIRAQEQRVIRRIQVQPHDIARFLDEKRIGSNALVLLTMPECGSGWLSARAPSVS